MSKRILSVILALSMLIGIVSTVAFAQSDYKYSKIAYYLDGTTPVYVLTPGSITAKVKVKSDTKTDELFFAMLLYKNKKLLDVSVDETPTAISRAAVQYDTCMTIPTDIIGLELVTVLWESKIDMKAVCASSIVPSSVSELKSIVIDGVPIENFAADTYEYDVILTDAQVEKISAPWIDCIAYDSGAKVEITHPIKFPGTASINVTASDGITEKNYTINYKYDRSLVEISNASVIRNGNNDTTNEAKIVVKENLRTGDKLVGVPQNIDATYVDPSLEGAYYIPAITGSRDTSFDITFKRDSKVNVLISSKDSTKTAATSPFADWTLDSTGWDKILENNWNKIEDPDGSYVHTDGITYRYEPKGDIDGNLVEWPSGTTVATGRGGEYDVRNQGWVYMDWNVVSGQNRQHAFCAFTHKYTKEVTSGSVVSISEKCTEPGLFTVIQLSDWIAPTKDFDTDLEL